MRRTHGSEFITDKDADVGKREMGLVGGGGIAAFISENNLARIFFPITH